jgi:hypothetical protein
MISCAIVPYINRRLVAAGIPMRNAYGKTKSQ